MLNVIKNINQRKDMVISIFALSWPSILEQLLETAVQYVSSAMVGQLGAEASAAVGLTTTATWLINSPSFAMGIGVLSYISLSIGAKKFRRAKIAAVQSIIITLILGIFMGIGTLAISPFLPKWLGAAPEIQRNASLYFGIICIPMIFRVAIIVFGAVIRSTGDMKTPMKVNLIMNLINIVLNFILIYGKQTISIGSFKITTYGGNLGVVGSAIAAATAYTVSGILMFLALYKNKIVSPKGEKLKLNIPIMRRCVNVGFPVTIERVATSLGQVVFSSLVTRLGTLAFAAHSIAITAEQAFYIPGYGMEATASTLAGNALGEKNEKKLNQISVTIIGMAITIMTVTGTILFLFPDFMMSLFIKDPVVIKSGSSVLRLVAISEPVFGALIILEGIFNGVGETKTPVLVSILSMWGVRILSTSICIYVFHLGLKSVWICMIADNVFRFTILFIRFLNGAWKKKLNL
ncbi:MULTISPECIES: MATE family efflux transporter [Clostridium]|uniref:Probable multidrug resistance protein NorM n=2 Tax=Clostridium acetobutylicum TaxID=1488 RepID=Q97DM8_CLOAB|nr:MULTISPECIES: MATE family efflux transporter [Clostridium]ADZ22485.1 putative cation efflux pump (multidrug resistance protein) [Clostridium acetobutylicum EA 2018]AAK81374.1 Probable cation efflux pump (multidrug resistance protein) [Clostridium acetobutylicum ATCC 824]AEI32850.1 cation efflux pump (multidrug resistance protein) [Clostridium acetobutylicum DSM 1731]AWV80960.1 MATE family efflux transporter [Clostridium acetobutylicum]MBC2393718.1 MATE family efflux transporter [Clostridium